MAREWVDISGPDDIEVHGESHHRKEIRTAVGKHGKDGCDWRGAAVLRREPSNKYDREAIQVLINGQLVGYIAKDDVHLFQPMLQEIEKAKNVARCDARVTAGWDRGHHDRGDYCVKLYVDLDFEPDPAPPTMTERAKTAAWSRIKKEFRQATGKE